MSSKLLQAFREQLETGKEAYKHQEAVGDIFYSTGFINIDYLNGQMVHVKNDHEDYYYPQLGVPDGKPIACIGQSHVGKTTFLIQMAAEIIRPFKNGAIWHADLEGGTNDHRIEILTKMPQERLAGCYHYQDTGITSEVFYEQLKWLRDYKIANKSDFMYDTGQVNFRGDPIFKYEPTCYIVDSLPMLLPDDIIEDDKVGGQMGVTSSVKMNTTIFRRIQQLCKEANIIIMVVNHILEDVNINPYAMKKAAIAGGGLKQGERLPGGKSMQYLSNTMFRIDAGSKLKPEEAFGIDGFIATIQTAKSRSNASAMTVPMIFDKPTGFNNDLSIFQLLKANNKIKGAGSYLYVGDAVDMKFSQKGLLDMLHAHPELRIAMAKEAFPLLDSYIDRHLDNGYEDDQEEGQNINDLIRQMALGQIPVIETTKAIGTVPKKSKKTKEEVIDILDDMEAGND